MCTPDPPLLSIILPLLEPDDEFVRCIHCIRSAFAVDSQPEVVVVTRAAFVDALRNSYPWLHVVAETRRGIYSAMNDGARASMGRYLYFLGKDDIVLPTFQQAVELLASAGPYALCCDVYWGRRGIYAGSPSRLKLLARNLCHQGVIYSRAAFEQHGPYLRRMRVQADHLLNIKVLWDRQHASEVRYMAQPLAWYSGSGFSNLQRDALFWRLYPRVMQRYVGHWAAAMLLMYRRARGR